MHFPVKAVTELEKKKETVKRYNATGVDLKTGSMHDICAYCEKIFYRRQQHAYKRTVKTKKGQKTKYFCSYTCVRNFDKERGK